MQSEITNSEIEKIEVLDENTIAEIFSATRKYTRQDLLNLRTVYITKLQYIEDLLSMLDNESTTTQEGSSTVTGEPHIPPI